MSLSLRDLNRATLARQLLLRREPLERGRRPCAGWSPCRPRSRRRRTWRCGTGWTGSTRPTSTPPSPTTTVVKATLMRITLHAVHADDYPAFHAAMLPTLRAARLGDRRFTGSGLTDRGRRRAGPATCWSSPPGRAPRPRSRRGSAERLGAAHPRRVVGAAARSPRCCTRPPAGRGRSARGRRTSRPRRRPTGRTRGRRRVRRLVRRYLEGFGPASVADMAQFALRAATRGPGGAARRWPTSWSGCEGPDGAELFDVPGAPRPGRGHPGAAAAAGDVGQHPARLRRPRPGHPARATAQLVTRDNGDVLPTLLVDGYVAGVWRPVEGGIEATAFHPLPDDAWAGLAAEARRAGGVPRRPGPGGLPPLRPLVGQAAARPRPGCCPAENFRGRMSRTGRPLRPGARPGDRAGRNREAGAMPKVKCDLTTTDRRLTPRAPNQRAGGAVRRRAGRAPAPLDVRAAGGERRRGRAASLARRRVHHGPQHVRPRPRRLGPDWTGWWGDEPPYHAPVFVLTHHEREPLPMEGGTTFHFVTDGIERRWTRPGRPPATATSRSPAAPPRSTSTSPPG